MTMTWSCQPFDQRIDAYLDWARGPGRNFPPAFFDYVIPLTFVAKSEKQRDDFPERLFELLGFPVPEAEGDIPPYFSQVYFEDQFLEDGNYVFTGNFPVDLAVPLLDVLTDDAFLRASPEFRVVAGRPLPADAWCGDRAGAAAASEQPLEPLPDNSRKPRTVIIGVIDEGIGFANERFRNGPTDSRVAYAWLQDARCDGPVDGFGYGREWRKANRQVSGKEVEGIDSLLARCLRGGQIDEERFYALAGAADFGRPGHKAGAWRLSHGTHVMDLAAGYSQDTLAPNECEEKVNWHIISVQLPATTVAETSGLGLEKFFVDGVKYIIDRAAKLAVEFESAELPLVINFSSGIRGGPHDGTSLIAKYVDALVSHRREKAPTQIVLPAGNSFLARNHAEFMLKPSGTAEAEQSMQWQIPPDDRSFSYLEIWLPDSVVREVDGAIAMQIRTPGGLASEWLYASTSEQPCPSLALKSHCGKTVCRAYYQPIEESIVGKRRFDRKRQRGRFLVCAAPTFFHESQSALAPSGLWQVTLKNTGECETSVEAWIQWDSSPVSYSLTGRQSYFVDKEYRRFHPKTGRPVESDQEASKIKRKGTVNGLAYGNLPVIVGGFHRKEHKAARYTAGDRKNSNRKPDYLAVCEESDVLLGVLGAGTRSGSTVALNGTSVAAPQVTRRIAKLMASGCTDAQIEDHLKHTAMHLESDLANHAPQHRRPPDIQMERRGKGRLSLEPSRPSQDLRLPFERTR